MDTTVGIDEFGREHFVVEAPRGRLGVSLGDDEHGFVVIRGLDTLSPSDLETWEEIDRRRVHLMRQSVQVGDRIVAIEGQDVVHCCLNEVIARLGKLSAIKRRLTFARYHESPFRNAKKYDVEKLVLARVPSGPLGLQINECIPYGAFIEDFQRLPDGSMSKLASHHGLHRGCQIIHVNGEDVSSCSRQEIITKLAALKDQEKQVVLYRATNASCSSIYSVDSSSSERHLGFTLDEHESMRCVITSVGPRGDPSIGLGDVLIGVNMTDITTMHRKDAIAFVKDTPLPRLLYFARNQEQEQPECHLIQLGPGPLGVNLDGEQRDCARITGFTSAQDAQRPEFKSCVRFAPGSYILSIGQLDVSNHDLTTISALLSKLKQSPKEIVLGNMAILQIYRKCSIHVKVQVPKGPLGVHFNGTRGDAAVVAGFYRSATDGTPGAIESCGRVPLGAALERVNAMNVSCLTLAQTTDLLMKLSGIPKEMVFHFGDSQQDVNTRIVDVRLPSGPLGIDLKSSIANKVIVDKMNQDPSHGSTRIFDYGGVIEGSEIVAIDGFDVSSLELHDVLRLLKALASHEKVIAFSTTRAAYEKMVDPTRREWLIKVDTVGSANLPLDTGVLDQALLASDLSAHGCVVPMGSRLVAIDNVDVRCLPLQQIVSTLQHLAHADRLCLLFDTSISRNAHSPSKPWLAKAVSSVLNTTSSSSSPQRTETSTENLRGSISLMNLQRENTSPSMGRPSLSTPDFQARLPSPQNSPRASSIVMKAEETTSLAPPSPRGSGSGTQPPSPVLAAVPSLSRLSVKTMEATRPSASESALTKLMSEKQLQLQQPSQASAFASKTEFLINMSSWTGSRTLYRLVLDIQGKTVQISPMKATSPRIGKSGGVNTVPFHEILAVDGGSSSGTASSLSRASLNSDGTERATIVLTTSTKKTIEFDMRSTEERAAFIGRMQSLVPALGGLAAQT